MQENKFHVCSTGVWMRTSPENVNKWRKLVKEVLKFNGYRLLGSTPLQNSHHMSFYDHTFDTFQSLVVNCFKNGHVQIKTKMVDKLFDTIIPQLEERLGTSLELEAGKREEYAPSMVEYLNKREEFVEQLRLRALEDEAFIQGLIPVSSQDMHRTDAKLHSARDELESVNSALHHLANDLQTFDTKSKESLRKCFDDTFYPEYYINNVDAFQRYMDARRERRHSYSSTC